MKRALCESWLYGLPLALLFAACQARADGISSVIPDSRMTTGWRGAGVVQSNGTKGIPTWTAVCATLNPSAGDNTAAIENAINACSANHVVYLNAGVYNITSGLTITKSDVVLRGAGPGQTILRPTDTIWFDLYSGSYANGGTLSVANWTGGTAKNSTALTLSSVSGLSAGQTIGLDQLNDTTYVNPTGNEGTQNASRNGTQMEPPSDNREQLQIAMVTAINGNQVTIDSPVYFDHKASLSPQAFWWGASLSDVGIENLTLDAVNMNVNDNEPLLVFHYCTNCWAKGIETKNSLRAAVSVNLYSYRNEVRDSYLHDQEGGAGPTRYGVELGDTSETLVENNVIDNITAPILTSVPASGNVWAYNYVGGLAAQNMFAGVEPHIAHTFMNLIEGNMVIRSIAEDNVWGSGSLDTMFRNRILGWIAGTGNPPYANGRTAIIIEADHQSENVIGNVIGKNGFHTVYEFTNTGATQPHDGDAGIYGIGYWGWPNTTAGPNGQDTLTYATLYRWGNFDTVHNAVQWNVSEVPSDVTTSLGSAPSRTLPASMYLSGKPGWWNSSPFPAVGPDVTGGNDPTAGAASGMVYTIPAQDCYVNQNLAGGGPFSPPLCYPGDYSGSAPDATPPTVPTGLTASAISSSEIDLSWTASTDNVGVAGYGVWRTQGISAVFVSSVTSGATFANTGLTPSTAYSFAVTAYDAAGNVSALSASAGATTPGMGHTYYVAANGSDLNTGTCKTAQGSCSGPWQHAPGMPDCAANCLAYQNAGPQPGDNLFFRGGDAWHLSAGSPVGLPWAWTWSGSSNNPIYLGVDPSWYSGSSWTRPVLNMDNPPSATLVAGCAYDDTNINAVELWASYVTFDDFEFTGKCWNGNPFAAYLNFHSPASVHLLIEHNYFHGWSSAIGSVDTHYALLGQTGNLPATYNEIAYNVIDGADSFHGTTPAANQCGTSTPNGPPCQSGFGVYGDTYHFHHNILRYLSNGVVSSTIYWMHDNLFEDMWNSYDGQTHPNVIESVGSITGAALYFYNNLIRHTYQNVTYWPQFNTTAYEFNNVLFDVASITPGNCFIQAPSPGSGMVTAYIYNNTVDGNCAFQFWQGAGTNNPAWSGPAYFENNHFIASGQTSVTNIAACSGSCSLTLNDNGSEIFETETTANAQGYTSSNNYAPTPISQATLEAGANLASSCSTFSPDSALCSGSSDGVSEGPLNGVLYPAIPVVLRPSNGAWDVGAYQFCTGNNCAPGPVATPTFTPPGGSFTGTVQVSIQSVTSNAFIYYTLDGSNPTSGSPLYSQPLTLSQTTTVKAIGYASGGNPSAIATAVFTHGSSGGTLPTLSVALPAYAGLNDVLTIPNYPDTNVSFNWTFTPTPQGGYAQGSGLGARTASGAPATQSFKSPAQTQSLSSYGLTAGTYQVSVYAVDNANPANVSNTVTQNIALLTTVETDFSGLKVYPNPWRSDKHAGSPVTFANLPIGSTVKLFTVSGREVKTMTPNLDTAIWDLTNDSGDPVASGIYVYLITDSRGGRVRGKLAVVK